jgi:hypothetical protein
VQDNWQWCRKCSGLAYFGTGAPGVCPAGGQHLHDGSANYELASADEATTGQQDWHYCNKCQGLYFSGNGSLGYCPAGDAHASQAGPGYRLGPDGPGQAGWRWCVACQGLWFAGDRVAGTNRPWTGRCPAPGHEGHSHDGSGNYVLSVAADLAGPAPVTGMHVVSLPNPPGDPRAWLTVGNPKWLRIAWDPYAGNRDRATIELYEGNGQRDDRFIAELPITATSNDQNMWGDTGYAMSHTFAIRVHNPYGWSVPAVASGTTLHPADVPPVIPELGPRVQFEFILSTVLSATNNWFECLTPDPEQMYVTVIPPGASEAAATPYRMTLDIGHQWWHAAAPAASGSAGSWAYQFHIGGVGAVTNIVSPYYSWPWEAASPAAYASCGSSGDCDFSGTPFTVMVQNA